MKKLINVSHIDKNYLLSLLRENNVTVYEDVQGSRIFVNLRKDGRVLIRPKSMSYDPLNFVDFTVQKFYQKAERFFTALPKRVLELVDEGQWYVFEYFADAQPANIKYDMLPKNGLVLTGIVKQNETGWIREDSELKEWADLMGVDTVPVLFSGRLTDAQIKNLELFLSTSGTDLEFLFGGDTFASFFYKMLNPNAKSSYLMSSEFQKNVEKLVIRFGDEVEVDYQLLNPFYSKVSCSADTSHVEVYTFICLNFLEWFQLTDPIRVKPLASRDETYVALMCELFNSYIRQTVSSLLLVVPSVPSFFAQEKFSVDVDRLPNADTCRLLGTSDKLRYVFKVIVGAMHRKRMKKIGLFTEATLGRWNQAVQKVQDMVSESMSVTTTSELRQNRFLTFDEVIGGGRRGR